MSMLRFKQFFSRRNIGSVMLHCSLMLIIIGGCITWWDAERGNMILNPHTEVSEFTDKDDTIFHLPFNVTLDTFMVDYYPGSVLPRGYTSRLLINGQSHTLSMNRIISVAGYRFNQSGYHGDGSSVIGVNHDPWGIGVTYGGYILFAVSGMWLLVNPRGRFRSLLRCTLAFASLVMTTMPARAVEGISKSDADDAGCRQVLYNGRVAPLNSVATEFALKVTGSKRFRGTSPEQLMLSVMLYPDDWVNEPLIKIKDARLRDSLGVTRSHASLSELFDSDRQYRLRGLYHGGEGLIDKAIEDVDERVEVILRLRQGELFQPMPKGTQRLSDFRVRVEIMYNTLPFSTILFVSLFTLALGMFATVLLHRRIIPWLTYTLLSLILMYGVAFYALRWIIAGCIPMGSAAETLLLLSLLLVSLSMTMVHRHPTIAALGTLMAGCAELVAHISLCNPAVTPTMPVLQSPWLGIHVTLVMTSYALLAFTAVISIVALCRPAAQHCLARLSIVILYPGVLLLGAGIFTGAVWANTAWGRYWDWDPKETWALISMIVYAVPLHHSLMPLTRPRRLHVYLLCAIASILMTYFGVNYLPSLHAYS